MQTKVLITGCLGLLGNHFSRYLLDKDYQIIGIDDCSGGFLDYLDPRVKFYKLDLADSKALNEIFKHEKPDFVVHFAAYASEGLSDYIKNYNYINNVICSVNVINCCINHNIKKILFSSSMAVNGNGSPPFKESDEPNPIDSYGIAKLTIEKELKITYEKFGLKYSIIRPHNVISPIFQNYSDSYRNVLAIWANSVLSNRPITVFGDGQQKRAFSDVKFLLSPMEQLLYFYDGEIFNLGSDSPITILDAAKIMQREANHLQYYSEIVLLENRTEAKFAFSDHTKAKKMLNFFDNTNLEQVIKELLLWIKSQPKRHSKKMQYETEKNLYSFWK